MLPSNGESSFQEEEVTKQVSLIKNLLSVFNDNDKITQMLALIKDEYIEQLLEVLLPQCETKEIIEAWLAHPGTQEETLQKVKKLIARSIVKMFSSTDLTPTVQEEEPALVCEITCFSNKEEEPASVCEITCFFNQEERKLVTKEYIKIQQELDERKIIKILLPSNGESSFQEEEVTKQVSLIKNLLSVFNDNDKITQMLALIKDEYIEQLLEVLLPQCETKEIIEAWLAHPGTQEETLQKVKKLIARSIVKMFSSTDLTPTVQEEEPALVCEPCSIFTCCQNQLQRS